MSAAAERKKRILSFIAAYLDEKGLPPSYREIAAAVGLSSVSCVFHDVQQLIAQEKLESVTVRGRRCVVPCRRVLLPRASEARRVAVRTADGGKIYLDMEISSGPSGVLSVSFSGVLDATELKARISPIVGLQIEGSE